MNEIMAGLPGLSAKGAIVWGGGAGMGLATARLLARSGCRVALVDRDGALAERSAAALREAGHDAIGQGADVTDEHSIAAALASAQERIGPVTLSANVVGIAGWKPLVDMSLDEWTRDQQINLLPMFLIGRAMARHLQALGLPGSLAFVASVSGLQAAHAHASYGAAKSGMYGLVQSMAAEFGPLGIRANLVAPGPIRTERITASPEMDALLKRRIPVGRMGEVDEMANCLAFLLSDLASYVTGQTIVADGGWMTVPAIMPSDNPRLGTG